MGGVGRILNGWSLQYRITAGVGAGLGLILTLFGYVAFWSIGQATEAALSERQYLAEALAHHVEVALADVPPAQWAAEPQLVFGTLLKLPEGRAEGLQLEILDGNGRVVVASAARRQPAAGASRSGVAPAVDAATGTAGTSGTSGDVAARPLSPYSHGVLLADLIAAGQAGVRLHRPPSGKAHIVAYAPLHLPDGPGGWGLTAEQPEDVVLALPHRLRDRMLATGAAALLAASTLAWLDARRVVQPLRRVIQAAQRIAAGDLSVPLGDAGAGRRDEVGQLSVALDTMRHRLVRSLGEIQGWNHELERRVRQRTRELDVASAQHRHLLHKVIWAQEEERKRLARELHDETVQTLSGLAMTLQVIEDGLPPELVRQRERLAWTREQAVRAAREIRQMILDLRPSALDDLGLIPAARWLATSRLEPLGVTVQFDTTEGNAVLPPLVQTAAFRVIQEALANVAKHACARRVAIWIAVTNEGVAARIEDDGCGFDPAALRAASLAMAGAEPGATGYLDTGAGLGLLGMQERVALLGGELQIDSAPGAGTRLAFRIPAAPMPARAAIEAGDAAGAAEIAMGPEPALTPLLEPVA